ncbi:MAG TPA: NrsF family protein [Myxococcaceae bacterium]|nr:NrsF family protein [Myxococcaceae bacterium]
MSDCDRFLDALASDQLDDAARSHARECQVCRPLLPEEQAQAAAPPASLEAVLGRALETLRTTPVRPWTRDAGRIALLQGVVAFVVAAMLGARNRSSPLANHMALAVVGAVLLAVVTLGSVLALAPGRRRPRWMLALVPVVPLLLLVSGNGVHTATTMRAALPCLVTVVLTAVVPLAVGLALLRGMALDAARTVALALSAAATGLFALHWHCTDGSAPHLMGFHVLPWLALALLAIPLRRALPTQNHVP